MQQGFDRHAAHAGHRQDAFRRQIAVHLGQHELGRVGKQTGVAAEQGALAQIIRFGMQLTFRLPQQRSDIKTARQQAGNAQQGGDIVDVAVDTLSDAGVLDLYGQAPPILRLRQMDLADRRCRHRRERELPEMTVPAMPPVGIEHAGQLTHRHGSGVGAQARCCRQHRRRERPAGAAWTSVRRERPRCSHRVRFAHRRACIRLALSSASLATTD
ncbi:MAG: hypothetical protein AW09_002507 [Candidatus Accumulibacter phosphatis]|uniref:Uncharacterized protein n=1 Tax=Candidatus Accumulibacter phosphatis TaxID=327160 RepID=A0A080LUM3_9PROT|nr:MAG: hypothetical protein AW09_002507 [Candidatus Accumulibacter phosphatis]